jgi:hypothetical protein
MHAQDAAAEPVDESAAQTSPTTTTSPPPSYDPLSAKDRAKFAEAAAAYEAAKDEPAKGPVRPKPDVIALQEIEDPPAPPPDVHVGAAVALPSARPTFAASPELVSPQPRFRGRGETSSGIEAVAAAVAQPLQAAPADEPVGGVPLPEPIAAVAAAVALKLKPGEKSTPPSTMDPVTAGDAWYPATVAAEADQRIAEKWRTAPVRGPPPTVATALGNSSTNTVTQIAVVRTPFGSEVALATQVQHSDVTNVGVATAEANGAGSAMATGNTADTSVTQVSVIVHRGGTGTASIEQHADVDNIGVASATTGAGNATAVGNDSSTNVTQVAVVYIEGSGDAQVTQSTGVANVGVASADAAGGSATAIGNQSTTDVTQVSVVHLGSEDRTVDQTTSTSNIGVAHASGGTASGNTATNSTVQVAKVP